MLDPRLPIPTRKHAFADRLKASPRSLRFLEPFEAAFRDNIVQDARRSILSSNVLVLACLLLLLAVDLPIGTAPWSDATFALCFVALSVINVVGIAIAKVDSLLRYYPLAHPPGVILQQVILAKASSLISDQLALVMFPLVLLLIIMTRGTGLSFRRIAATQALSVGIWGYTILGRGVYLSVTGKPYATVCFLAICLGVSLSLAFAAEKAARAEFAARLEVASEQDRSERLVSQLMPGRIAERIKNGESTIADSHAEASVLFADLTGFTALAETLPARDLVSLLDEIFSRFDDVSRKFGLEKLKTVGDAYMAAAGLTGNKANHAVEAADCALALISEIEKVNVLMGLNLQIRVGIASGPVVAGIIGKSRLAYDVWGDTVNVASRMESQGAAGKVQVNRATRDLIFDSHLTTQAEAKNFKGKGVLESWFVEGRRPMKNVA